MGDPPIEERAIARCSHTADGCMLWPGAMSGKTVPTLTRDGRPVNLRRHAFLLRYGWVPANLGICPIGGVRCINPEHARLAPHALPKFAIDPGPRRLRELGALSRPSASPAVSDVVACPVCGHAVTGFRPIEHGFLLVGNAPECLRCAGRRVRFGGTGAALPKYALDPTPRRRRYLADRASVRRLVDRGPLVVPEPTVHAPVDLWLFEDRRPTGSPLRDRLAARNLATWRRAAEEALAS